ncbi:hypothetical protein QQ020_11615 [Fulvivirgaceae bacterium BMA12]|uniref:Lipoprotein n=1 Tax=Agaribacillus aureus TaxID=3051825 RepID=A0ABT8L627_9BACT|nr:hypothetical protein [Fulvivirgaceae bacterium BMA12]
MKTLKENQTGFLKIVTILLVIIVGCTSCNNDDEAATTNPGTTSSDIIAVPFFVETADKQMPTSADQLLYETRNHNPVKAPDGQHLSWGEFSQVTGTVIVNCMGANVKVDLTLNGLIPNGVYTIWNVTFDAPGMDPSETMLGLDGIGAAGKGNGSDNYFTASANGSASISIISPGGSLSMMGTMEACPLTDNFEWHIIGTYHMDGKTYGPDLGPDGTVAEQFGFIFKNETPQ